VIHASPTKPLSGLPFRGFLIETSLDGIALARSLDTERALKAKDFGATPVQSAP